MNTAVLTRIRRRPLLALAIVCVGVILILVVWRQAASGPRAGSASGSPTASVPAWTPPPATATPGPLDATQVESVTEDMLEALSVALADPEHADLSAVMTGSALEAFENQREEWANEQWHQENAATVDGGEVMSTADDGTSVTAQMCIDSSAVRILDDAGTDLNPADAPQRSAMILTYVLIDGRWLLSEQGFAEDPNC